MHGAFRKGGKRTELPRRDPGRSFFFKCGKHLHAFIAVISIRFQLQIDDIASHQFLFAVRRIPEQHCQRLRDTSCILCLYGTFFQFISTFRALHSITSGSPDLLRLPAALPIIRGNTSRRKCFREKRRSGAKHRASAPAFCKTTCAAGRFRLYCWCGHAAPRHFAVSGGMNAEKTNRYASCACLGAGSCFLPVV